MIILHNSKDGNSNAFVATVPAGTIIIDWYVDAAARAAYVGPAPTVFPSAVIKLANGSLGIVPNPVNLAAVIPANVATSVPLSSGMAFLFAIQNDASVLASNALLFNLAQLLAMFQVDLQGIGVTGDPTPLRAHWQAAISYYGGSWLTASVQTMITGYATTFNIPLV